MVHELRENKNDGNMEDGQGSIKAAVGGLVPDHDALIEESHMYKNRVSASVRHASNNIVRLSHEMPQETNVCYRPLLSYPANDNYMIY